MSLSDKILTTPKGLTCICGHCDLRKLFLKDVKEAVKELEDLLVNEWEVDDEEVERQLIKIFGDDLI